MTSAARSPRSTLAALMALALSATGEAGAAPAPAGGVGPVLQRMLLELEDEQLTGGDPQLRDLLTDVAAARKAFAEEKDPSPRALQGIAASERISGDALRNGRAAYLRAQLRAVLADSARGTGALEQGKALLADLDLALASVPALRAEILAERGRARAVAARLDAGAVREIVPNLKAALGDLDQALAAEAEWPRALVERGRIELVLAAVVGEREGEEEARGELALPHLERALADFDGAARRSPGYVDALAGAAAALERLGRWPEAVERLEAAAASGKAREPVAAELARARAVLANRPAALAAARGKASRALDAGDYTGAVSACDEALGLEGGDAQAILLRGQANLYRGQLARAEADLSRAVALTPGSALALALRGQVRAESKRLPDAIADLKRALALDPRLLDAVFGLALAYLRSGDLDRSIELGEQGVARGPEWFSGWYNLAAGYGRRSAAPGRAEAARRKDRERAFAALEAYAKGAPKGPETRGTVSGDPDLASLRKDPRFAAVLDRLGPGKPGRTVEDWAEDTLQ